MMYFWLLLGYLLVRMLFHYAFYEQGMTAKRFLILFLEGFVFTFVAIIMLIGIGLNS